MTTPALLPSSIPKRTVCPCLTENCKPPCTAQRLAAWKSHFMETPGAHVNGNTLMYYVEGDRDKVLSPDCYVVFGLSDAELYSLSVEGNNTYLLWEVGKPPDFVLEIGSPSTGKGTGAPSGTCTRKSACLSTGVTTPAAGTTTASRWWASGWRTGNTGDSSCATNAMVRCGRTVPR